MDNTQFKVIKIGREALYEFVYEKFIEDQAIFFEVDPTTVIDSFMMDDEQNQFIFMVHKAEDEEGHMVSLPREIDLAKLLIKMPNTTSTMFSAKRYRELSLAEIMAIQES